MNSEKESDDFHDEIAPHPLIFDRDHARACHERWVECSNRQWREGDEEPPDSWTTDQCGGCIYYILLEGPLGGDWGVCSNPTSKFDGRVMFEHDGCDQYVAASYWVGSYIHYLDLEKEMANGETAQSTGRQRRFPVNWVFGQDPRQP